MSIHKWVNNIKCTHWSAWYEQNMPLRHQMQCLCVNDLIGPLHGTNTVMCVWYVMQLENAEYCWHVLQLQLISHLMSLYVVNIWLNEGQKLILRSRCWKKISVFRFVYVLFQWKRILLLCKPAIQVDTIWWPHKQSIEYNCSLFHL